MDLAINEAVDTIRILEVAPSPLKMPQTNESLYFGRIAGEPDVFFLDRATYGDLIRGVTTARPPNP